MAPKKKKAAPEPEEDDIAEEFRDLEVPQLREKIEAFQYRLAKASKERNYMVLEQNAVEKFYHLTLGEEEQMQAQLLEKEHKMGELEKTHRVHLRVHEQKSLNLEYTHSVAKKDVSQDGQLALQQESEGHEARAQGIAKEKIELQRKIAADKRKNLQEVERLQVGFSRALAKLEEQLESKHQQLLLKYEGAVADLRDELALQHKVEVWTQEQSHNSHLNQLMTAHRDAFADIKSYYKEISRDNLELIRALRQEISTMLTRGSRAQQRMSELAKESAELTVPLAAEEKKLLGLRDVLKTEPQDVMALRNVKARSGVLAKEIGRARDEVKQFAKKLEVSRVSNAGLHARFEGAVQAAFKQAELQNLALEKTLEAMESDFTKSQTQLAELLHGSNLPHETLMAVTTQVETALQERRDRIGSLQYQMHYATKTFNDASKVLQAKLQVLQLEGAGEVNFAQLPTATSAMPAGLVTYNPS